MILVFGSAYPGKTAFVEKTLKFGKDEIFQCSEKKECATITLSSTHCIYMSLDPVERGENPIEYIQQNLPMFRDKIIICDDISCGIVPLGKDLRLYRDQVVKLCRFFPEKPMKYIAFFAESEKK